MRSLNMGGMGNPETGGGTPGGANPIPNLASLLGGNTPTNAGGTTNMGPPANMKQLFSQLPQMVNGLLSTPLFKDYLNNTEKQEQRREAILNNLFMRSLLETDPERDQRPGEVACLDGSG